MERRPGHECLPVPAQLQPADHAHALRNRHERYDVGEYNTYYDLPNKLFINSMDPVLQRYMAFQFNETPTSAICRP